jgi:TnpA family transposase
MLYAGIIGKGCAIGTPKIARISSQINENKLSHVINWYFSLENIRAANDCVIKLLDGMELPDTYRRSKSTLHTASDGQKFTARTNYLNANYSFKYFGKEQGVSAYTFVDERNLLWHSLVFSAAERESAYVIDGLMRNDVVKSDIHSTDTHGYSEAIFAVTYLLGFSYAPRIKNLKKQTLYTFKTLKKTNYPGWNIIPDKYINRNIIEETWDDVLRLVSTIKLKETTASEIFRRLNSYSKQHRLYQGLKAFGQIIKSQFILRYLDDVELRQAIEKQLNKVELANRLTRAVAVGDPRGFIQPEKEEQEIAEACNRLIKNSIICWNYLYIFDRLARLDKQSNQQKILLSAISSHSVMSWAHINMLGEYDFSDIKLKDSFGIRSPTLLT